MAVDAGRVVTVQDAGGVLYAKLARPEFLRG
jgi:hypothetical protein